MIIWITASDTEECFLYPLVQLILGTLVSSLYGALRKSEVPTVLPNQYSDLGFHRYPKIVHPKVSFGSCITLQGVALPLS